MFFCRPIPFFPLLLFAVAAASPSAVFHPLWHRVSPAFCLQLFPTIHRLVLCVWDVRWPPFAVRRCRRLCDHSDEIFSSLPRCPAPSPSETMPLLFSLDGRLMLRASAVPVAPCRLSRVWPTLRHTYVLPIVSFHCVPLLLESRRPACTTNDPSTVSPVYISTHRS